MADADLPAALARHVPDHTGECHACKPHSTGKLATSAAIQAMGAQVTDVRTGDLYTRLTAQIMLRPDCDQVAWAQKVMGEAQRRTDLGMSAAQAMESVLDDILKRRLNP